jgi:uncharacterized protein YdeI (YjbR/CyaY-like superfamily)
MMNLEIQPVFFKTQSDFRKWLAKNHNKSTEIYVGYYKVGSGKQNMTWSQSVDEAICYGWIDGIRKTIDNDSYFIRFSPRKPGSNWSVVNIKKVEDLSRLGLLKPAGIAAFHLRQENKSGIYSYENKEINFSNEFENLFKLNKIAWSYFQSLPQSYKKPSIRWVMSAKRQATCIKRLEELIRESEAGRKIKPLSY